MGVDTFSAVMPAPSWSVIRRYLVWETLPSYLDSEERFLEDEKRLKESYHCRESASLSRDIKRFRNALTGRKLKDFPVRHLALTAYTRLFFSQHFCRFFHSWRSVEGPRS